MIKLEPKVNKSEIKRQAREEAERRYKNSDNMTERIWSFTDGVEFAFKLLRAK